MAKVNQVISFGQTQMPFPKYEQNPTNFFWRFSPENSNDKAQLSASSTSESESEEPEINLCLSLGGLYAKPTKENQNPLARSSSIAGEESETHRREIPFLSLSRSCSLPTESNSNGEEAVRLRDLQYMRRMVAKKRLAEKQKGFREEFEEEMSPEKSPASEMAAWAATSAAKNAALSRAICKIQGVLYFILCSSCLFFLFYYVH